MSSKVRNLARSKARYMMEKDGRRIFGWGRNVRKNGKSVRESLFARAWRDYASSKGGSK